MEPPGPTTVVTGLQPVIERGSFWRNVLLTIVISWLSLAGNVIAGSPGDNLEFTKPSYNSTVPENSVGKTYVIAEEKMGIFVSDSSLVVRYRIVSGDPQKMFKAEAKTVGDFCFLLLRTRTEEQVVLNREYQDFYALGVRATITSSYKRSVKLKANTEVLVSVLDTNDLNPLFYPVDYRVSIPEDFPLHKAIVHVTATDPDVGVNGEVYYSLAESSLQFAVHPTAGFLSLTRPLDQTAGGQPVVHSLTVLAEDRGPKFRAATSTSRTASTATVQVQVTPVNLYSPEIQVRQLPAILERSDPPELYAIVRVSDRDKGPHGQIQSLEIVGGDNDGHFRVTDGESEGEYKIQVQGDLVPADYALTLMATDAGTPPRSSTKVVHVKVSESTRPIPKFAQSDYDVEVEEVAPIGFRVVRLQTTLPGRLSTVDGDRVLYAVESGNDDGAFVVNARTGLLTTAKRLDRERRAYYSLTVSAVERGASASAGRRSSTGHQRKGIAIVNIRVIDDNDNDPVFNATSLTVTFDENKTAGSLVHRVYATDADKDDNGYVTYSLANLEPVPFAVDHFSGEIRTTQVLDYETMRREYFLIVRASDWGSPYRRQAKTTVRVRVRDVNDHRPLFEKVDCAVQVSESTPTGTEILTLSALDFDAGNMVQYVAVPSNDDPCFQLDPDKGVLKTTCDLRRERPTSSPRERFLNISATDGQHFSDVVSVRVRVVAGYSPVSRSTSYAVVDCKEAGVAKKLAEQIKLANSKNRPTDRNISRDSTPETTKRYHTENKHAPEFPKTIPFEVWINESSPAGTEVVMARARDRDHGYSGLIVYVIDGSSDDPFRVDLYTGRVLVDDPSGLDRERTSRYVLNITAFDLGRPQRSSTFPLIVHLRDLNDNAPRFERDSYHFSIPESVRPGFSILRIAASDPDEGDNALVRYGLEGPALDIFRVDPDSGLLSVAGALDRELTPSYSLRVWARDSPTVGPALTSWTTVYLRLEDINDNAPAFGMSQFWVKVREDLPIGSVIMVMSALDPDLDDGGFVSYEGSGSDSFAVDPMTGVVRVADALDFETKQLYNVSVKASDRGNPPLSSMAFLLVEIEDVNENVHPPKFDDVVASGTIKENEPEGTFVLKVSATDADPAGLDSTVFYAINGDGLGLFSIDDQGNIRTRAVLDRERSVRHWLTVIAQDRGAVPLTSRLDVYIEVTNENDNVPLTLEPAYNPSIPENSPPGTSVTKLEAFDLDVVDAKDQQRISFRITAGDPQGFFRIHESNGSITSTTRLLDREAQEEHVLEVTVSDNGLPTALSSTTRVVVTVVDLNDHEPVFLKRLQRCYVAEIPKAGHTLCQVLASDRDSGPNGDITYSLEGPNARLFRVHPKTGSLHSQEPLRRGQQFELTVKASDAGKPSLSSSALVILEIVALPKADGNRAPTILMQQQIHLHSIEASAGPIVVSESDPVGHLVALIQAQDPDGDRIWYSITGGNSGDAFVVQSDGGAVLVARTLEWEAHSDFDLVVSATDGLFTVSTHLHVRVMSANKFSPEFLEHTYKVEISENSPVNTEILRLEAVDRDRDHRLTYTIHNSASPNSLSRFRLDSRTGSLTVASPLDHETAARHILTVAVTDSGTPSRRRFTRLEINVHDHNDHAPAFFLPPSFSTSGTGTTMAEGRVYETAAIGTKVLQVTAVDRDRGMNALLTYAIVSGNVGSTFSIDSSLGIVRVAQSLDRRSMSEYFLIIRATDGGQPPLNGSVTAHIVVTVADNAAPRFEMPNGQYVAELFENGRSGAKVAVVSATSRSSVHYELIDGHINDSFSINPTSGVVRTTRPLDYETQKFYNLTIKATNMVGSSALTTLLVHVLDRNDNRPSFLQEEVFGIVSETADVDSIVLDSKNNPLVVAAADPDSELNAVLRYGIVDKEARLYFKVDPSTGAISTAQPLDHEKFSNYTFRVQVTDTGRPRLSALVPASVHVTVIDVNDSPPQFERTSYSANLLLPTYEGVLVAQVKATDPDETSGQTLKYNLVSGNEGDKFAIDGNTGQIFVRNHEDLKEEYQLVVSASDSEFEASAKVAIKVKDPPLETAFRFSQEQYEATVIENSTGVTTVAVVGVVGLPLNQHIQFRILNPSDMFQIGETSGAVRTVSDRPFDREVRSSHVLVVEARRKTAISHREESTEEIAHVLVKISVLDVNDNAPIFVNLPYYSVVPTEAEKGYVVRKVHAIDLDLGENGRVHYELVEGDNRTFEVDPHSGEIVLLRPIAHTLKLDYSLIIEAIDSGPTPLRSKVEVPIRLINRDMPVFPKPYYNVSVVEALPAKSAVITVLADSPEGRQLIYSLVDGNDNEDFGVDFTTEPGHRNGPCIVYVVESLDYERTQRYQLTLRATDSVSGAFADVRVHVDVRDVNDNAPEFEKTAYEGSVSEAAPFGTSVLRVRATDRDSGPHRRIQYYVIGNATSHFHVESTEGIVFVKQPLDREREAVHRFLVLATDGGSPPLSATAPVTVDVLDMNDNPPRFEDNGSSSSHRQCSVSEGAPRGHFVTRVVASDPDISDGNRLSYALVEGNEQQVFAIDPSSGIVTLSNLHQFGNHSVYSLNVSVTDGVYSSYCRLRVDVSGENAHSPQFTRTVYEVTVPENKAPGSPIATVKARDIDRGDYGKITYSVESPLHAKLFFVDPETGVLFTSVNFDRERQALYEVAVAAFDGGGRVGYATVRATVTNENDNAPEFPVAEYRAYVYENISVGTTVLQVEATDADEDMGSANMEYSIYASNTSAIAELFGVSKDRGEIYLKRSLLKFGHQAFQFFVRARDKGSPPQESEVPVNVMIVSSDVAIPRFERPSYEVFVSEKSPISTVISALNATGGFSHGEHLRYAFLPPPPDSQFELYQSMFSITEQGKIVLNSALDRESASVFRLAVKAESLVGGVPRAMASCALTIRVLDENDNHPIFETDQYVLTVAENIEKGSNLLKVVAHDSDLGTSGEVHYTFGNEYANAANVFRLDAKTGWIATLTALDYERVSSYKFSVVASDNGQPPLSSTATVLIKVRDYNDNPSEFERRRYDAAIYEDAAPGTDIVALEVRDRDVETAKVDFYITSGNPFEQFQVRHTGEIYVKRNLDRESVANYLLEVTCTDGLHVSRTQVAIDVLDANDNPPTCLRSHYNEWISEIVPPNTYVVTVEATDADDGRNALRLYSLSGDGAKDFVIDSFTGVVKTAKALDRERQARYFLVARVQDRGRPEWECLSRLEVALDDVNDNPPKFTESTFAVAVPEDAPLGSLLTKVHALDPDLGMSRKVSYSLTESANGIFAIDPRTGIVRLQGALDRESRQAYNLSVQAQDHGDPPLASVASIAVTILDVNDNPPEFEKQVTGVSVSEDAAPGTALVTLRATSRDVGDNARISYAIVAGDDQEVFHIHPDTGLLEVAKALDYERVQDYLLTIEARDAGTPPLSSRAVVNVSLSDANDNPPVFSRQSYAAVVPEDAVPGTQILQVVASDADSDVNGRLSYSIASGDSLNQFKVDPSTGIVQVATAIDREMVSSYVLHVRCVDGGSPSLSSTSLLHVTVSDVNDNAPLFSMTNYTAVVQEGKPPGHPVLTFSILDADEPTNGAPFRLAIVEGDEEARFHIAQQDLSLKTRATLRARLRDRYMLRVRVTDSGSPPLSSEVLVDVTVAEESRYPPRTLPLEVTVNSYRDDFPGGVLGRVRASDDDPYDEIRFAIVATSDQQHQQLFTIDREDGTILALPGLDVGSYTINVSVTDGKFTSYGTVSLEVLLVTEDALRNAVGIRLKGLSPEDFLLKHQRDFLHGLRTALDVSPKNLDLLSIQPAVPQSEFTIDTIQSLEGRKRTKRSVAHNQNLDVLFSVRKAPNVYYTPEIITTRLKDKQALFESSSGLKVLKITKDRCTSNRCGSHGKCVDRTVFDEAFVVSIATENLAYVSPQHLRKLECVCQPGYGGVLCESVINECARKPCSPQHLCFPDTSNLGYVCHCPPGKTGPTCEQAKNPSASTCPLHHNDKCYQEKSPVSYNGRSYARYSLVTSVERRLSVSLHLRTVQLTGNIMYLAGVRDYSILEIVGGYAQFRFDCGSGEGLVRAASRNIADGHWHLVRLDRRGNAAELVVDEGADSASGRAPGPHDVLNLDGKDLFFGAEVRQQPPIHTLSPSTSGTPIFEDIRMGFIGCMDDVKLDGVPLPLQAAPDARGTGVVALRRFVNVEFQCSVLFDPGPCGSQPCANGGSCRTSNSVSFTCRCPERFLGPRCETDTNPCASSPCLNGGSCHNINSTFLCECPRGLSGSRCDYGRYCNPNPCHHGGACEEGTYGALCKCRGFYGDLCQWDVDECQAEPCGKGSRCLNVEGSFHCQCPPNATGILCNEPLHRNSITSTRWNTTVEEIVGIAVLVVFIMLLAGALACCWRIRHKQRRQRRPGLQLVDDPAANEFMLKNPILLDDTKRLSKMSNIEATFATPPLPPRPASYTPSTQESLSTALAKFDTVRDYGSAAQDLDTQQALPLSHSIQQRCNQIVFCNDLDGGNSKPSITDSETLLINNKSTTWETQEQLLLNNSSPPSCDEKVFEDKIRNDLNPSAMHPPSLVKKPKCQKSSGVSSVPSLSSVDDLAGCYGENLSKTSGCVTPSPPPRQRQLHTLPLSSALEVGDGNENKPPSSPGYQWDISDWATASSDNGGSSFVMMEPKASPTLPESPSHDHQQDSSSVQSTDSNSFISQIEVIPGHTLKKCSPDELEEETFVPPPPQWSNKNDDDDDSKMHLSPSGEVRTYGFPTQGGLGFRVALEHGDYGDPLSPNSGVEPDNDIQNGVARRPTSVKPSYV